MNDFFNTFFDAFGFGPCGTACTVAPATVRRSAAALPSVDAKETAAAYTLDMDLPGHSESDVELNLKDNVLTIASRAEEREAGTQAAPAPQETDAQDGQQPAGAQDARVRQPEEGRWLIRERAARRFARSFALPEDVDAEAISATFKNGVLTVTLPRVKPADTTRRIAITAA